MLRVATLLLALVITSSASAAPADLDLAALRTALAKQREVNLARFHRYRTKGVYPHNRYQPGMLNVWKDLDGHLCAIATLISQAGLDGVVESVAKDENFVRIADLTNGPVIDWMLTSGLTQEEVVMIQQPSAADVEQMEAEQRREERRITRMLKKEDARLRRGYIAVERALAQPRITDAGLDLAVARLAQHPQLAAALIAKK